MTNAALFKRTLGKMLLELLVGFVVSLLVVAGVLVMVGPNVKGTFRRIRSLRRPTTVPSVFQKGPHEVAPAGLNPKTQRVLVAAPRLANWRRRHGPRGPSPEPPAAAARLTSNAPGGLITRTPAH